MPARWFECILLLALLCFIWLAWKVAHGEMMQFDCAVRDSTHSAAAPGLTKAMESITFLGSQAVVLGVSVCVALLLLASGRRDDAWLVVLATAGGE